MRALVYKFEDGTVVKTLAEARSLVAQKGMYEVNLITEILPVDKQSDGSGRPAGKSALEALRLPKGISCGGVKTNP